LRRARGRTHKPRESNIPTTMGDLDVKNKPEVGAAGATRILVALDGSKYSDQVLQFCADHLKGRTAKLTFVHVYEYHLVSAPPGPGFALAGSSGLGPFIIFLFVIVCVVFVLLLACHGDLSGRA